MSQVVLEGWLTKQGHKNKNWKRRYFKLQNSLLSYYESETATKSKGDFLIINAEIKPIPYSEFHRENCFAISSGSLHLFIQCSSFTEESLWISKLTYVSNNTKIIKCGTFEKLSSDNLKWDTRYFVLIPSLLAYYAKEGGEMKGFCPLYPKTIITKSQRDQTSIVSQITGKPADLCSLFSRYTYSGIYIETQLRQFLIRFRDYSTMEEWYNALKETQEALSSRSKYHSQAENKLNHFDLESFRSISFARNNPLSSMCIPFPSVGMSLAQQVDRVTLHLCPKTYSERCLGRGYHCLRNSVTVGCILRVAVSGTGLPSRGYQYAWQRSSSADGEYEPIPNSNMDSYAVQPADVECYLRVSVKIPFNNNTIVERVSNTVGPIIKEESENTNAEECAHESESTFSNPKLNIIPFPSYNSM